MKDKLGADGDFAQGYVIAHEVGHHVQKLLGIEPKVRQLQQNATQAEETVRHRAESSSTATKRDAGGSKPLICAYGTPGRLFCRCMGA